MTMSYYDAVFLVCLPTNLLSPSCYRSSVMKLLLCTLFHANSHTMHESLSVFLYLYFSMNPSWNFEILDTQSVPGAKNVVLKCNVLGFCPNPLPGTTQIPVPSRSSRQ